LDKILDLVSVLEAEGIHLHHLDLGGGLGIRYNDEQPPEPAEYIKACWNDSATPVLKFYWNLAAPSLAMPVFW